MPTRPTTRRPLGAARFDPAIPDQRRIGGVGLPEVCQPRKTARRLCP